MVKHGQNLIFPSGVPQGSGEVSGGKESGEVSGGGESGVESGSAMEPPGMEGRPQITVAEVFGEEEDDEDESFRNPSGSSAFCVYS